MGRLLYHLFFTERQVTLTTKSVKTINELVVQRSREVCRVHEEVQHPADAVGRGRLHAQERGQTLGIRNKVSLHVICSTISFLDSESYLIRILCLSLPSVSGLWST